MFKNMKISAKLISAFMATVLIASIAGVVGLFLVKQVDSKYSEALITNGFVQGDIGDFNTYLQKGAAMTRDVIMLTDAADIKSAQTELDTAVKLSNQALDAAKLNCQTPEELAILAKIDAAAPKYVEARDRAVALGLQNKNDEALQVFRNEARPYLNECVVAGQELMALNSTMGDTVSAQLTQQSNTGVMMMILIIVVATGIAVALALFVSRSISLPVKACSQRLEQLADGDLHSAVPKSNSQDEVGIMLHSLEDTTNFMNAIISDLGRGLGEMSKGNLTVAPNVEYKGDFAVLKDSMSLILTSLNSTLGQINQASEQVSAGSDQVSAGAQALSQGATEQASSVEELAATITEISSQIQDNAMSSARASKEAEQAGFEMVASNKKMQALIDAMSEISNSSQQISRVIKTIEDIAFQTNILALNAAVEAARAGTAGKGFAVVADEVRNLASKSAEAAKSTTELIEGSISAVENGTTLANDTAKSFDVVVGNATTVSEIVAEISKASTEQAQSIAQVTQGIDQISSVVQTNSATAEESAAASEELSGQASMLKQLVGKFKLTDSSDTVVFDPLPANKPVLTKRTASTGKY
ncbi:MAG: methyl-accepting chemotaxis protein [Hungatella sp.]